MSRNYSVIIIQIIITLVLIIMMISPKLVYSEENEDIYYVWDKPGKRVDVKVSAKSWSCEERVFDGKSFFIDMVFVVVPGGPGVGKVASAATKKAIKMTAKEAAKRGTNVALSATSENVEALLYRATLCKCRLDINWTCKTTKKKYQRISFWWDTFLGTEDDTYNYQRNKTETAWTECSTDDDNTCKEACFVVAASWPDEYMKEVVKGDTRIIGKSVFQKSKYKKGWQNTQCEE